MEEKLSGIVLSGISIGESDKLLSIFTLEKGTITAKIKGVKKAGAKLKFASEPFCFAEFIFSTSNDRRTVIGASLIDSFYSVREDIVKFYSAGVITEYIKKFLKEGIISKEMFMLSIDCLKEIAYGNKPVKNVLVKFLLTAITLSGFALSLNGCNACGKVLSPQDRVFFNFLDGDFFCENCAKDNAREINYTTFSGLQKIEKNENIQEENAVKCLRFFDYYLENKPEVKLNSLKELLKILN